jgi:hypothetical protein
LTHNNATDAATGPVDIPWPHLALSAVPLLVVALLSVRLQLELHHKLVIAILRCFGQLSALGWVLVPIFKADSWWLTMLYGALMVVVASFEAISRPQHTFHRALFFVVLILGTVAAVTVWFGLFLVVGVSPWYDPQYMIPILGMVLGNSCSGISVGLTSILNEFVTGRDHIELLLSVRCHPHGGDQRVHAPRYPTQHDTTHQCHERGRRGRHPGDDDGPDFGRQRPLGRGKVPSRHIPVDRGLGVSFLNPAGVPRRNSPV